MAIGMVNDDPMTTTGREMREEFDDRRVWCMGSTRGEMRYTMIASTTVGGSTLVGGSERHPFGPPPGLRFDAHGRSR